MIPSALAVKTRSPSEAIAPTTLNTLATPALVLDYARFRRNVDRLAGRMQRFGVMLRPHLKSAKSLAVAHELFADGLGPITVSTLKEAEYFAAGGVRDITYAVGIASDKIERVLALRNAGVDVTVLLDTVAQAQALAEAVRRTGQSLSALIEIDCDDHRGGLRPDDPLLLVVAGTLVGAGVELKGVLTHAGESYGCRDVGALEAAAEGERAGAVAAAELLRRNGYACPVVSVGSTPTAHFVKDLAGVTEVRAGVYMFFDLVMHGIGVCEVEDIALSVLSTVIGHKPDKGWILIDAGWMALSRDRGTARQPIDQGYGLVCDIDGQVYPDLLVSDASQEHGILSLRPGSTATLPDLPLGARIRILPNHACATSAQHDQFQVVRPSSAEVSAVWQRMRGW